MAVVNQLNLNIGTEQNPNFVVHDINDKRISKTAVTTATHLLTCNSGVTSIAPITAANLASVLGVVTKIFGKNAERFSDGDNCNNCVTPGVWIKHSDSSTIVVSNNPNGSSNKGFVLWYISPYQDTASQSNYGVQVAFDNQGIKARTHSGADTWGNWTAIL